MKSYQNLHGRNGVPLTFTGTGAKQTLPHHLPGECAMVLFQGHGTSVTGQNMPVRDETDADDDLENIVVYAPNTVVYTYLPLGRS